MKAGSTDGTKNAVNLKKRENQYRMRYWPDPPPKNVHRQLPQLGRGNFVRVAHVSPTKNFGGKMLTWVWLARASHELTKPKSTFAAPKIFCGR